MQLLAESTSMWLKFKLFLALFVLMVKSESGLKKVCLNKLGCLLGTEMPPAYSGGESFEAFLGVPYAKPPIGNLRFRNPEPVLPWQGILMANKAKPDCKQRNYLMPHWPISGDEDCLYMNIYRPLNGVKSLLPVIFYIYGGGFFSGSANPSVMGPEYFMETREVLVVVIAYRLGPFGFLSSGSSDLAGNFGLKDQLLALKWVNEHIAAFGGDPNAITLFGHSAGASSVHFHMINPKTKGLFKRAILSSGNVLAPFVGILNKPLDQLHQVAQALGIETSPTKTLKELAAQLRTVDANAILQAGDGLKFWFNHNLFNVRPVIENASDTNAYLIEHPLETIRNGNYELRSSLMGFVSYRGEGAAISLNIYDNQTLRNELNQNFDDKISKLLDLKSGEKLNRLIDEYMQGIHELNTKTANAFFELISDYHFHYPVYSTLKYYFNYADTVESPQYIYKFSYHGPYTYAPFYAAGSKNPYDVVHFDDLLYQFRQAAIFPDFEKDSIDHQLRKEFLDILLAYIKTGKPLYYNEIGSCTKDQFVTAGPKSLCKYLELINSNGGYKYLINNAYPVDRMKLWDEILN